MLQSLDAVQDAGVAEFVRTDAAAEAGTSVADGHEQSKSTADALWAEIDERYQYGHAHPGATTAAAQARMRRSRVRTLRRRRYTARSLVSRLCPGVAGAAAQVLQILMEVLAALKDETVSEWYQPRPAEARRSFLLCTVTFYANLAHSSTRSP